MTGSDDGRGGRRERHRSPRRHRSSRSPRRREEGSSRSHKQSRHGHSRSRSPDRYRQSRSSRRYSRSPTRGRRRSRSRSPRERNRRRSSPDHHSHSSSRRNSATDNRKAGDAGLEGNLMEELQAKARAAAAEAKKEHFRPELPSYIKPGAVNVQQFAAKERKKKLLWKNKSAVVQQTYGGESHNKWEGVAFDGNDADAKRNKFLKLMGLGKKAEEAQDEQPGTAANAANGDKSAPLLQNLEQQFHTGLAYTFDGRKKGLGFGQ